MGWAILKPYAKTIFAAAASIMVFAVLAMIPMDGRTGLEHIIGAGADFEEADYASFQDAEAMKLYTEAGAPKIRFVPAQVFVNKSTDLNRLFQADGTDGRPAEIMVEDVQTASGDSILFASEADRRKNIRMQPTDAFQFAVCGIYSVYVKAVDGNQCASYMKCKIPVAHE